MTIKYVFTDSIGDNPMTPDEYIEWDCNNDSIPFENSLNKSELAKHSRNVKYIIKNAVLMTPDELKEFKNIDKQMAV